MKRINFTVVVCLTLSVFSPFLIQAEDVLKECNPSGTTVMIIGDIVACAIDPVADSDFFTFSGRDGETVMLTLTETGGDYYPAPYLEFFDPDDERIDDWYAQNTGVSRQFKLTKTGTYTVLVHEWQDDQTVAYIIALQRISPTPADAMRLPYDDPIENETISPVADSDIFFFSGVQDDFIMLTLTETGGDYYPAPYLEFFDPDDERIDDWYAQNTGVSRQFKLTKTGTYTVLVHEWQDDQTVAYIIALQRISPTLPGAMRLPYDDPIENETISPVTDSDIFRFCGVQDDFIMLTLTETGGDYYPAPYLEFFDPDDERIDDWYAQNTGVSRQFKLTKTGAYTVLVHEWQDDQTVAYNLGLSCITGVCPPCPPYPLAEIIGTWSSGIRYRDVAESSWTQMWPTPPDGEDIAAGDFTGDGRADVASIWDNELYYQDGATLDWTRVPGTAPDSLTAGDVTGDRRSEIIGTWSNGIWYWDEAVSKWTKMYSTPPDREDIAAGDFTGDGRADVASIWDNELYYQDGATLAWTRVPGTAPDSLTAGDVTGDGHDEIIGAWSNGIWYWDEAVSKWTRMTSSTPTGDIAAGDFTGDGIADVASCWDSGLWYQDGVTLNWTKVSNTAPTQVTAGDVTGD